MKQLYCALCYEIFSYYEFCRYGRDRMIVEFTSTYIGDYHH